MARAPISRRRWQTGLSLISALCLCASPVGAREGDAEGSKGVAARHATRARAPSCTPDPTGEAGKSAKKKNKKKRTTAGRSTKSTEKSREARASANKKRRAEKKAKKRAAAAATYSAPANQDLLAPEVVLAPARRTPPPVVAEPEDVETAAEAETECSETDSESCSSAAVLSAFLGVYTGFTSRSIELPTISGMAVLATGALPSLALQLGARLTSDPFFGIALTYHRSLGAEATQAPSDPLKPSLSTTIQSHHFEGGVSGGLNLSRAPGGAKLGLFLGYGIRTLGSEVELRVPRFSLHGPVARLELELPLGAPWLVLRLAPEAQLIAFISDDLANLGVGSPIWAFGGEAGLQLWVSKRVALQLSYREAHAVVPSVYGGSFSDVERFGLLGLVVDYL